MRKLTAALIMTVGLVTAPAEASPIITIPAGLNAGDTYFLAFVTAETRDATSSDIADYDAFVTAQAGLAADLAALGTTWKVIGSTINVGANTHVGVTGPVYNLGGQEVATGLLDMFDRTLMAPIKFDQFGGSNATLVWTGSEANGEPFISPIHTLGFPNVIEGLASADNAQWLTDNDFPSGNSFFLYGISVPLVVPTAATGHVTRYNLLL